MRYILVVLWMLFCSVPAAMAQVSIGIGLPGVSIGINLPVYPELVQVPGYPVYYAPRMDSNYFFYDGMYWVYQGDNWYASTWYNGPWGLVGPESVPLFVLRIPVRYYRQPPMYFGGWRQDAPPRWGEHWGNDWEQRRSGWDRWNRGAVPAPAPLPAYQRQYSGDRYPRAEQQQVLRSEKYRYQPREPVVRQHYQEQAVQRPSAPDARGRQPAQRGGGDAERSSPSMTPPRGPAVQEQSRQPQQGAVQRSQPAQRGGADLQKPAPAQAAPQQRAPAPAVQDPGRQPQQGAAQRGQQRPQSGQEAVPPGKGAPQEPGRARGQEKEREKDREKP